MNLVEPKNIFEHIASLDLEKLKDHIISGEPDTYFVYAPYGSVGNGFDNYEAALEAFMAIKTPGFCSIQLATRIGTGVTMAEKWNE